MSSRIYLGHECCQCCLQILLLLLFFIIIIIIIIIFIIIISLSLSSLSSSSSSSSSFAFASPSSLKMENEYWWSFIPICIIKRSVGNSHPELINSWSYVVCDYIRPCLCFGANIRDTWCRVLSHRSFSAKPQHIRWVCNGNATVFHYAIDMSNGSCKWIKRNNHRISSTPL